MFTEGLLVGPVARPGDTAEIKRDRSVLVELSSHCHLVSLWEESTQDLTECHSEEGAGNNDSHPYR